MSVVRNALGDECERLCTSGKRSSSRSTFWFWAMWTFIGLVSCFDAFLVYRFVQFIPLLEENPICRFLIRLDAERLSVFLPAKALGTISVLAILRVIYVFRREYSIPITGGVAAYQAGLVLYLIAA